MIYILAAILISITLLLAAFGFFAFTRRKKSPVALSLSCLLASLTIYAGAYAGELLSVTLGGMLFWNRLEYVGISFLPALWIIFTARYVNSRYLVSRRVVVVLLVVSLTTLAAVWTDPILHLRYVTAWVRTDGPFPVLAFTRGPFYWSHTVYSFLSFIIGTVLLVRIMFNASHFFRRQQLFMLAGTCLPWMNYMLYLSGISVWGIDTIPFSMFLSAVCFGTSIFGFKILDVIPVARGIVFETMSDGVIVLDVSGRIVDYNRAAAAVFPELNGAALSIDVREVLSRQETLCARVTDTSEAEFLMTVGEGEFIRYYQSRISTIRSRSETPIGKILLFKDNTDSTLLLEKLRELATIDPLTRLFNRRHFLELTAKQLSRHARTERPLSLLIIDLDHFKHINDTYGHLMGDDVLRTIAGILSSELRGGDIASRFGGEEFICLLPETDSHEAFTAAERMRQSIRKTCIAIPGSQDISISASFGVYTVTAVMVGEKIETLIARADLALYRSKETGRNRTVVYTPEMEKTE